MQTAQLVRILIVGCALLTLVRAEASITTDSREDVQELWNEPVDLERRDLFRGPPIGPSSPPENGTFAFVKRDTSGRSPGYDVRDANGVVWSVKLGHEAQPEVVASRILWAIGFHQPPTYLVTRWTLTGQDAGAQEAGRFRPELGRLDGRRRLAVGRVPARNIIRQRWAAGRADDDQQLGSQDLQQQDHRPH